jgi:hypothetical protein
MIWIYFSLPETRFLRLEEVEALFGNSKDTVLVISPAALAIEGQSSPEEKGITQHVEL